VKYVFEVHNGSSLKKAMIKSKNLSTLHTATPMPFKLRLISDTYELREELVTFIVLHFVSVNTFDEVTAMGARPES
jgi:hypothetical protein